MGEGVEHRHVDVKVLMDGLVPEVRADEAGTSGDEETHAVLLGE